MNKDDWIKIAEKRQEEKNEIHEELHYWITYQWDDLPEKHEDNELELEDFILKYCSFCKEEEE